MAEKNWLLNDVFPLSLAMEFDSVPAESPWTYWGPVPIAFNAAESAGVTVAANTGILTFTGFAPSAVVAVAVSAATGALTAAGQAPSPVLAIPVPLGVGALTLAGQMPAPTVAIAVPAAVGALQLSGQSPAAVLAIAVPVDVGALVVAGLAPTAAIGTPLVADTGVLALDGLAPSPTLAIAVLAGTGQLEVAGFAPELLGAEEVVPPPIAPGGFGLSAAAAARYDWVLKPAAGALVLLGYAPSLEISVPPDPAPAWDLEPWSPERDSVYDDVDRDRELVPAGVADDDDELLALFHFHEA